MPDGTRQFMESRFQADFSGVRIHTGPEAEQLSTSIQAQAFAHGKDIYFNQGKFSPDSTAGRTLLAHELTHTVQQNTSSVKNKAAPKNLSKGPLGLVPPPPRLRGQMLSALTRRNIRLFPALRLRLLPALPLLVTLTYPANPVALPCPGKLRNFCRTISKPV